MNDKTDLWMQIIKNIERSANIRGRIETMTDIGDLINNFVVRAKNDPSLTVEVLQQEVMQKILLNGITMIQEKIALDKKIEVDILVISSSST